MTFPYEELGPERFQELCQALLVREFPRLQCFPVGMPDGGRDAAISRHGSDVIVFQIKYRRRTPLAEATHQDFLKWLQDSIAGDLAAIDRLVKKGLQRYVIISNVPSSSHANTGSRDRMQAWLSENMPSGIESDVWWREDLDRRLESQWELRRIYGLTNPQSGESLLRAMVAGDAITPHDAETEASAPIRFAALRKFIRSQFDKDSTIRFREADLPTQPLLPNYLDIGAEIQQLTGRQQNQLLAFQRKLRTVRSNRGPRVYTKDGRFPSERDFTAAALLLQLAGTNSFSNIVFEGAPGQGKSTLVQYVCQVHRARLLGREQLLRGVPPEYRTSPVLLPFRTDLRDLSAWLQGSNPFGNVGPLQSGPRTVESFLAAMVSVYSGGSQFTVDDLDNTIMTAPTLLVFDGLDEVAEIESRREVVQHIVESGIRLQEIGLEVRIVVTSRPSAFAAAPRFPPDRYTYITLADLNEQLIQDYTRIWAKARRIETKEVRSLSRTLTDKLQEPHIAELSRNSMQLAILLWLIYQQTSSLPEQRTRLYEQYINTFLNREASKSEVIRRYREPIEQFHGHLAWILHARAERGHSQGNITEAELKDLLRDYLQNEGYSEVTLVDELFQGMVERLVALVSRVQGTYEFEVQPLREYFAARHLYRTARYAPPGLIVTGTKADRFDVISRNPYWQNVTRFYVGFFDRGELAYLTHCFSSMFDEEEYGKLSYPRVLANSVIADQVFGQSPALGVQLARRIVADDIGWFALTQGQGTGLGPLPRAAAGLGIVTAAEERLGTFGLTYANSASEVLRRLKPEDELLEWWRAKRPPREGVDWLFWLNMGIELGTLEALDDETAREIFDPQQCDLSDYRYLLEGNLGRLGLESASHASAIIEFVKAGVYTTPRLWQDATIFDLAPFLLVFSPLAIFREPTILKVVKSGSSAEYAAPLSKVMLELESAVRHRIRKDIGSVIRENLGPCWLAYRFDLLHSIGAKGSVESDVPVAVSLLNPGLPFHIKTSACIANSTHAGWWRDQLSEITLDDDVALFMTMLLCIATEEVVSTVLPSLVSTVNNWSIARSFGVLDALRVLSEWRPRLNLAKLDLLPTGSPVLMAALGTRVRADQKLKLLELAASQNGDNRLAVALGGMVLEACVARVLRTGRWVATKNALLEFARYSSVRAGTDLIPSRHFYTPSEGRNMEPSVARQVLAKPDMYPPSLVRVADATSLEQLTSQMLPVAEISARDKWFDQAQPI